MQGGNLSEVYPTQPEGQGGFSKLTSKLRLGGQVGIGQVSSEGGARRSGESGQSRKCYAKTVGGVFGACICEELKLYLQRNGAVVRNGLEREQKVNWEAVTGTLVN